VALGHKGKIILGRYRVGDVKARYTWNNWPAGIFSKGTAKVEICQHFLVIR